MRQPRQNSEKAKCWLMDHTCKLLKQNPGSSTHLKCDVIERSKQGWELHKPCHLKMVLSSINQHQAWGSQGITVNQYGSNRKHRHSHVEAQAPTFASTFDISGPTQRSLIPFLCGDNNQQHQYHTTTPTPPSMPPPGFLAHLVIRSGSSQYLPKLESRSFFHRGLMVLTTIE